MKVPGMNQKEFIGKIFKECQDEKDHAFSIVCCFNDRKDMKHCIQAFLDKFIYIRRSEIHIDAIGDYFTTRLENIYIYFIYDGCKCLDGLNPSLLFIQEGCYNSNIADILQFKSKCVKNSQIYYFI